MQRAVEDFNSDGHYCSSSSISWAEHTRPQAPISGAQALSMIITVWALLKGSLEVSVREEQQKLEDRDKNTSAESSHF